MLLGRGAIGVGWVAERSNGEEEIITRIERGLNRGHSASCCGKARDKKPDPWGGYLRSARH